MGVDYSTLTKIKDSELMSFVEEVERIVSENNWELFIENCAPDHFEVQFEELNFSKSSYIQNNLMVFSVYKENVKVINKLPEVNDSDEFAPLNQIVEMSIIGINEIEKYEGITSLYGYLKLKNNTIRAVNIWVTKRNGKYQITGAVG